MDELARELQKHMKGEVSIDEALRDERKHDASVFELMPAIVVFPKDTPDLQELVSFVTKHKSQHPKLSLTPRGAGTDMSGGAITDSVCVDMKYFNHIQEIGKDFAIVEPGTYYRDFEPETFKHNLILPCYTS